MKIKPDKTMKQLKIHVTRQKSETRKKCSYPAAKWTPYGDASAKVPQDPDDDDAGAQPVGSGLGTQARAGEGAGGAEGHEEEQQL